MLVLMQIHHANETTLIGEKELTGNQKNITFVLIICAILTTLNYKKVAKITRKQSQPYRKSFQVLYCSSKEICAYVKVLYET